MIEWVKDWVWALRFYLVLAWGCRRGIHVRFEEIRGGKCHCEAYPPVLPVWSP